MRGEVILIGASVQVCMHLENVGLAQLMLHKALVDMVSLDVHNTSMGVVYIRT